MRFLATIILAISLLTPILASTKTNHQTHFLFNGSISIGNSNSKNYEIFIPSGYVRYIDFEEGLRLEFSTPRQDGDDAMTITKWMRKDGKNYRVLKVVKTIAPSKNVRSFSYAVCGEEIASITPAGMIDCS